MSKFLRLYLGSGTVDGVQYVSPESLARMEKAHTTSGAEAGLEVRVYGAESFIDAVVATVGIDPLRDGLRVMDGRDMPDPLVFDAPTVIGQDHR